jgi:transposase-like protein
VARARIGGLTDRDLQDIRDKKRWDEATARRALDGFQESGLSMAAFAAETGIGAWRLRDWQRKLGRGQGDGDAVRFLPVRVRGAAPAPQIAGAALEVTTPSGFHVRTEGGFALEDLVRLIGGLEQLGC